MKKTILIGVVILFQGCSSFIRKESKKEELKKLNHKINISEKIKNENLEFIILC
ncbi:hypothetical protein H3N56_11055 [Cetobacterium sp. 2A]|uniref:hypothetical protein n=1 Tax=Cetobacterium sp. 2A TaxID=2754723 RepID=UPI00163CA77E|nr:hypothetical protein [Cetobacterium sp. 2A]MBC2856971.1 hypothetical protein [Cetobacterium sp. 2A]